jgi:hypothetical protein
MIARVTHLHLHNAPLTTPIHSYKDGGQWYSINTTSLTQHLRWAATALGNTVRIMPSNISICSLRSSGAMALLCADVDTDKSDY